MMTTSRKKQGTRTAARQSEGSGKDKDNGSGGRGGGRKKLECAAINCKIVFTPSTDNQLYHSAKCRDRENHRLQRVRFKKLRDEADSKRGRQDTG